MAKCWNTQTFNDQKHKFLSDNIFFQSQMFSLFMSYVLCHQCLRGFSVVKEVLKLLENGVISIAMYYTLCGIFSRENSCLKNAKIIYVYLM